MPDGVLKLTVVGGSPACPNPRGASSGYVIHSPQGKFLVDCGHGVASILPSLIDLRELSGVVISHMHPDHFFDLVPLKYAINFSGLSPLPLWIPPGATATLRRLQEAVPLPPAFYEEAFEVQEFDPETSLSLADVRIDFCGVQHFIPSWGMRFSLDGGDRALVYTADTAVSEPVKRLLRGAAVALMEATLINHSGNTAEGHMTAEEAGRLAQDARVERLIVTHVWEPIAPDVLRAAASSFGGPTEIAQTGKTYEI